LSDSVNKSRGDFGDQQRDMQQRETLIESSLPQVFAAYDQAIAEGVAEPVVILLDCQDPIGSKIAREWVGSDAVDDALAASWEQAEQEGAELFTTLAEAFPFEECRQEVSRVFSYLAGTFEQPPEEGFVTVVVTAGGAATFVVPPEARS